MACRISCAISIVFIIGMIYMTNAMSNNDTMKKYKKQLPYELQGIYKEFSRDIDMRAIPYNRA